MPSSDRTLIIGAGIVGLSIGYDLARRGQHVVLLDEGDLTTSASTGNAGIIALGHPPLPRPGLIVKTLRWMLDPASPLYVPLRVDLELLRWMMRFARACGRGQFECTMELLARLGHATGACFDRVIREESIACDYRPQGWLEVWRTAEAREAILDDARLLRAAGYDAEEIGGAELRRREPALAADVGGAVLYGESFSMDPGAFLRGLADAVRRHGAELHERTAVQRLDRRGDRVDAAITADGRCFEAATIILAAGSWTTGLARSVGVSVPMQPGKGYHVHVPMTQPPLHTACVFAERHIAVTPMHDRLRLAGTVELSGLNLRLHPRRVEMLSEGATEYLPALSGAAPQGAWCGLRPCTADGLPVVGFAPGIENLFIATGHARMGMTLGPITGKLVSEWLLDGSPSIDISAMSPGRFG